MCDSATTSASAMQANNSFEELEEKHILRAALDGCIGRFASFELPSLIKSMCSAMCCASAAMRFLYKLAKRALSHWITARVHAQTWINE